MKLFKFKLNAFIILFYLICAESKIFSRCDLAKELTKLDFPRTFLSNWICLIENESGADTKKIVKERNLSANYGLFQINSKLWCRPGYKGGICDIKCEEFLNDNLMDDAKCAKEIFNRHGFQAWAGWAKRCRGRPLPDVSKC